MSVDNKEAIKVLASDHRYEEINYLQTVLMIATNLKIAADSQAYPKNADVLDKPFVGGYTKRVAGELLPETVAELNILIDHVSKLQAELLKLGNTSENNLVIDDLEQWERDLKNSPMGDFIETLDFDKRMK